MSEQQKPTRHGPNVGTQAPVDTGIIGLDPNAAPRRQGGDPNKNGIPAVGDLPAKTHGGKVLHHCDFGHKSPWDCSRHSSCMKICVQCGQMNSARGRSKCRKCLGMTKQEAREEREALEAELKAEKKLKVQYNKFNLVARKPKHTKAQREQALLDQQEAHEASGTKLAGGTALAKMIIPRHPGGIRKRPNRSRKRIGLSRGAVERIYHMYRKHLIHIQRLAKTDAMDIDAEEYIDKKSPMDIDEEGYIGKNPYEWEDAHVEHMTGIERTGMSNGQMERFKADAYKGRKLRQLDDFMSLFKSPVRARF